MVLMPKTFYDMNKGARHVYELILHPRERQKGK